MNANTEKCADKDKTVCDYNEFRRLRYFHGMLLDDKDFRAEQEYHAGKRRLLNRMLHGSGVVCGLDLNGKKDSRWIEITSGLALDCSGNEIWVPKRQRIDLDSLLPPKEKPKSKAECEEVEEENGLKTYYIGIRYDEKPTNPVSVYLPSGGCEERTCENSRYKEGFCIEIVECCPEKEYPGLLTSFCDCETGDIPEAPDSQCWECGPPPGQGNTSTYGGGGGEGSDSTADWCKCVRLEEFCEKSVKCPECGSCDEPCFVVLGQIKVDEECRLQSVCINECRKYVLTGRLLQHMVLGVFGGSEDYFYADVNGRKIPIPAVAELVHNPIKALCWAFRYLLIEGGEFKQLNCQKEEQDRPNVQARVDALSTTVQEVSYKQSTVMAQLERLQEVTRAQQQVIERLEKQGTGVKPAAKEKPGETPKSQK